MMLLEPGGLRWLYETWLKVDRGVSFYNTSPIPLDAGFLISRLGVCGSGPGSRGNEPAALCADAQWSHLTRVAGDRENREPG